MTTPTEAELDALVEELTAIHAAYVLTHNSKANTSVRTAQAADAITALRAELAAERARAIEAVEAHFPGRLYASSRMNCIAAITATKGAIK